MTFKSRLAAVAALAVGLSAAADANAAVQFRTNYSDGLSSWASIQQPAGTTRINAVAPPAAEGAVGIGARVMRVELQSGDLTNTSGYVAPRAEVYGRSPQWMSSTAPSNWPDPVGAERWYRFSVLLPNGFYTATDTRWLTLTQWKGYRGGSPPIALELKRSSFRLGGARANAGLIANQDLGPITPGRWTTFMVGMKLSTNASDGWVQVYRDGRDLTGRVSVATMDEVNGAVDPIYLKQGIYRDSRFQVTQVVYFGDLTVAERFSDISAVPYREQTKPVRKKPKKHSAKKKHGPKTKLASRK